MDSTDMIERVRKGKEDLEALVEKSVHGFRAPLLQHSRRLLGSLGKAGYDFDSSVPSWEPLSPTSFRSHGVGSVFPFWTNGVLEIPVSLVQDHQYLRVLGRSVPETVDSLLSVSNWIGRLGGVCVLLVHPDYDFGLVENEGEYRRLLESFQNKECEALTLGQLTNWWATRTQAILKAEDGQVFIDSKCGQLSEVFDIQLVGGFDHDGFRVEHLS